MKHTLLISAVLATLSLVACEKSTTVNVPPTPSTVPGPAGPTGATGATGDQGNQGNQGNDGTQGTAGKTGGATTVIVVPPASAPAN
jgi:hypothetical protein